MLRFESFRFQALFKFLTRQHNNYESDFFRRQAITNVVITLEVRKEVGDM